MENCLIRCKGTSKGPLVAGGGVRRKAGTMRGIVMPMQLHIEGGELKGPPALEVPGHFVN